jgi:hypothetical protein
MTPRIKVYPLTCSRCGVILADDGGDEITDALCYECVTLGDVRRLFRALDAIAEDHV